MIPSLLLPPWNQCYHLNLPIGRSFCQSILYFASFVNGKEVEINKPTKRYSSFSVEATIRSRSGPKTALVSAIDFLCNSFFNLPWSPPRLIKTSYLLS